MNFQLRILTACRTLQSLKFLIGVFAYPRIIWTLEPLALPYYTASFAKSEECGCGANLASTLRSPHLCRSFRSCIPFLSTLFDPKVQRMLSEQSMEPLGTSVEEINRAMKVQLEAARVVYKDINLKPND